MIKIIKGSYGLKVDGVVTAMRPGSDPFSLSEAREAELVALGVAEKVETAESDYAGKTMAELRTEAAKRGVDVKQAKSKREVITALESGTTKQDGGESGQRRDRHREQKQSDKFFHRKVSFIRGFLGIGEVATLVSHGRRRGSRSWTCRIAS